MPVKDRPMPGLAWSAAPASVPEPPDFERVATGAALGGDGWPELLGLLRSVTGRHCRLVAPDGALLASTDEGCGLSAVEAAAAIAGEPASVTALDGWRARAAPVTGGNRTLGLVLLAEPASDRQVMMLRGVVTAIAIEAVRRDAAQATRPADPGQVIGALRRGEFGATETIVRAAARTGLDLGRPGCGAVLRHLGSRHRAWETAIGWLARTAERDGDLVYVVVADGDDLLKVRERLEMSVGAGTVRAACGSLVREAGAYQASFAEAERLLRVMRDDVLCFADAGLLQVLLAAPSERLAWFVDRHLGPILNRPDLMMTLRAWLATNGSRQSVSEQLHLHRNSVGYRVGLLKSLLGVDPGEPSHAAVLHLALAADDLLRSEAPVPL
jgi:hypothetical protein